MADESRNQDAPFSVLIADDDGPERDFLKTALRDDGYEVLEASDGRGALDLAEAEFPDVVVMDVLMPGMGGIEACRLMSSAPGTASIPVVLVTAQRGREVRLEGIAAGARDFLLKPVDLADFRVRIRNAAQMKRMYDQSEARFRRISELETLRDSLVHMIVHDIRTPLSVARGNLELIEMSLPQGIDADVEEFLGNALTGVDSVVRMLSSILDVSKFESETLEPDLENVDLLQLVKAVCGSLGRIGARIRIAENRSSDSVRIACDRDLIQRTLQNLLTNALDFSPVDEVVTVLVQPAPGVVRIKVIDRGPGIPEESKTRIFEKFGQVSGRKLLHRTSVGLGLAFSKLAVEAHGGRIGVETPDTGGATFWIELPRTPPAGLHPGPD